MKKILIIFLFFLSFCFNQAIAQCDPAGITISGVNGVCLSDMVINVSVPLTGSSNCPTLVASLRRASNPNVSIGTANLDANGRASFANLGPDTYYIVLTDGITNWSSNTQTVSTTYTPFGIPVITQVAPLCQSYTTPPTAPATNTFVGNPDDLLAHVTITIPAGGGTAPFTYKITDLNGIQTFGPTNDLSHTFAVNVGANSSLVTPISVKDNCQTEIFDNNYVTNGNKGHSYPFFNLNEVNICTGPDACKRQIIFYTRGPGTITYEIVETGQTVTVPYYKRADLISALNLIILQHEIVRIMYRYNNHHLVNYNQATLCFVFYTGHSLMHQV